MQKDAEFLIAKKIEIPADREKRSEQSNEAREPTKETEIMPI